MSQFIESLRRLYMAGNINIQKVDAFLADKKINQQEYDYIISAQSEVK